MANGDGIGGTDGGNPFRNTEHVRTTGMLRTEYIEKAKILLAIRQQLARTGSRETQQAFNTLLRTVEAIPTSKP